MGLANPTRIAVNPEGGSMFFIDSRPGKDAIFSQAEQSAGGANFGSSDFQQTILGEAVKNAVDQMSTGLVANNTKLQTRTINVSGLVAAVEGGQIILNVGGKAGLKVGDQLNVERVTREIKDPATGQVIRRLASPVGVVKITEVDDISSVAVAVSGTGFKVGDAVKTVAQ